MSPRERMHWQLRLSKLSDAELALEIAELTEKLTMARRDQAYRLIHAYPEEE